MRTPRSQRQLARCQAARSDTDTPDTAYIEYWIETVKCFIAESALLLISYMYLMNDV